MDRDPESVVRAFWERMWTDGEADLAAELFAPGALENGEPVDVEQWRGAVAAWTGEIFPDFRAEIEELHALPSGRVVSRVTYSGTHRGRIFKLDATGRRFSTIGVELFTVEDGRITELWHATDHLELVIQLGGTVAPDPGVSANPVETQQ